MSTHRTPRHTFGERTHPGEAWDWEGYAARARMGSSAELRAAIQHLPSQQQMADAAPIEGVMPSQKQMADALEVGHTRIGYAMLILRYAPAEAKQVISWLVNGGG